MRLNLTLLVALLVTVAANLSLRDHPTRKNIEVIPEMVHSVAYESFSANPNFPDGKTMQPPVPGTVPRNLPPLDYDHLSSPVTARTPGALERGATVFQVFCQPCHGGAGKGDGPVAQRGFPPPPSLSAEHARGLADAQIFQIVTQGQKNMPSYAGQVSRDDRWRVILYVRSLQEARK